MEVGVPGVNGGLALIRVALGHSFEQEPVPSLLRHTMANIALA